MNKKNQHKNKIGNLIFTILLIILIPLLIVNLCIMYQANTKKDTVPSVFGYKPFIVLSGSMETKIHVGDLIITKITDPKTLKKDNVIAFRDAENTVTTHRIIDIVEKDGEKYFVTKGDNNDSQDQNLVEYKDVEGIYITRIPGIGTMLNELAKPTTIIIVVLGVTVIFILMFQISNKKLRKIEDKEYAEFKKFKEAQQKKLEEDSNDEEQEEDKETNNTSNSKKIDKDNNKSNEKKTSKKNTKSNKRKHS